MAFNNITRALVIDDTTRARAKEVQAASFLDREALPKLLQRISTGCAPPGDSEDHTMIIDTGFKVVYSIEQQPAPANWCQHISVSVGVPAMSPDPAAVVEILKLFGIESRTDHKGGVLREAVSLWTEKLPGGYQAINLLYPFDIAAWIEQHPAP